MNKRVMFFLAPLFFATFSQAQIQIPLFNNGLQVPGPGIAPSVGQCPTTHAGTLTIPLLYKGLKATACTVTAMNAALTGTSSCTCSVGVCQVTGLRLTSTFLNAMTPGSNSTITTALTYSITNPGGIKSGSQNLTVTTGTWSPACLDSGLKLWVDANDTSTQFADIGGTIGITDGTALALWRDKSSNANHVSQGTLGSRPTYQATGLNSRKAIVFSASVVKTMTSAARVLSTNQVAAFSVLSSSAVYNTPYSLNGNDSHNRMNVHMPETPGANNFHSDISDGSSWARVSGINTTHDYNTAFVYGQINNSTDGHEIRFNGATVASGSHLPSVALGSGVAQVGSDVYGSGFKMNGAYQEFVVIEGTTSNPRLEGYLAHKWGLTGNLPGGHTFKTHPP